MGYVQADIKMNFNFGIVDFSSLSQTFNLPIPTPPPLPPPLTVATATADHIRINNHRPMNNAINEENLPQTLNEERNEDDDDGKQEEVEILNENNQVTQNQQGSTHPTDNNADGGESTTLMRREVLEEAINFDFDVIEHPSNLPSDNQTLDAIDDNEKLMEAEEMEKKNENFDLLPTEILVHIFTYLNSSDLKYVALVCRRFLDACMYKKLSKSFMLNFVDSFFKQFSVQISQFVDTFRIFPAISVNTGNFDVASTDFWLDYGLNIEELYFRNGILRKKEFEDIIRWTANLKVLKIEANSIFRTWDIRGTYHERVHVFENCHHISLTKNNFLNRKIFDYVVSKAPNLRELDLSFCMQKMSPTDRNALLDHLIFFLKGYGDTIKMINLRQTPTDDFFLDKLAGVRCLKLKSLAITFNGSINNRKFGLIPLIEEQYELEELDMQDSPAVEETVAIEIGKHMKLIKKINLRKCSHVTDYCLREFSKLEHLESLDITNCDLVTSEGIHDALLTGIPKRKLRELYFGLLPNITENLFSRIGSKLTQQLTTLDIGGSNNLADDTCQVIFSQFPYIRNLNVDSCCKITDYGFTGKFQNQCYYSIKLLRGLRVLRMQNLYKLTDFALIDSFEFNELREIYMARSHFTAEGIRSLVEKCPAIELLDLSDIESVDDDVVDVVTTNLKRLLVLKLNSNTKITEKIFEHIANNCREMRYLYIRNCSNVNTEKIKEQLYFMRSLKKVYMD